MKDYNAPLSPAPRLYVHGDSLFVKGSLGYYVPQAAGAFVASLYQRYRVTLFVEARLIQRKYPMQDVLAEPLIGKLPDLFLRLRREGCPLVVFEDDPRFHRYDPSFVIHCPYNTPEFERLYTAFTVNVLGDHDEYRGRGIIRNSARKVPAESKKGFGSKF